MLGTLQEAIAGSSAAARDMAVNVVSADGPASVACEGGGELEVGPGNTYTSMEQLRTIIRETIAGVQSSTTVSLLAELSTNAQQRTASHSDSGEKPSEGSDSNDGVSGAAVTAALTATDLKAFSDQSLASAISAAVKSG
jgi:hypothetical protein